MPKIYCARIVHINSRI